MLQRDFFTNFTNSHFFIVQSLPHSILETLLCGVTQVADHAHHETLSSCWSGGAGAVPVRHQTVLSSLSGFRLQLAAVRAGATAAMPA